MVALCDFFHEKGDVEKAFEESYLVIEDSFETPAQDHGYMEPDACFTFVEDGRLMAYTASRACIRIGFWITLRM